VSETWDWAHQRAETEATVEMLTEEGAVEPGALITLDLEFVAASADADLSAFVRALASFGYRVTSEPDDDGVEIAVPDVPFSAEGIWLHEERTTRIALARGFEPDGWGFFEP
jgi:hypothetical protein